MATANTGIYNIDYVERATALTLPRMTISVTDDEDVTAPVDLTGYTATFKVSDRYGITPRITLTEISGITLGGDDGTIDIEFTLAQIQSLPADYNGYYELDLYATAQEPMRYLKGRFCSGL